MLTSLSMLIFAALSAVQGISFDNSSSTGVPLMGKFSEADLRLTLAFPSVVNVKELSSA